MSKHAFWPLALIGLQALSANDAVPRATGLLRSLPMVFEPNTGRWAPEVKFTARANDYRVLLSARGAVFEAAQHTISVSPLNANPKAELSGASPLPFRTNYFLGSHKEDWRGGVTNYAQVRYRSVYPGIDLVYYGSNRQLEYDFIIHPGADPSRIRLKFDGIERISVTASGDLVVGTGASRLTQRKPVVYQEEPGSGRHEIRGVFKLLAKNVVGFSVESYDRSRALTIDPVLTYASLIGGGSADAVTAAKIDKSGIVYLAGYVGNSDITAPDTAYQTSNKGASDIFVAKIDPSKSGAASLLYFTYIGGTGADIPTAMAIDGSGTVYLTGSTTSTDFPLAGGGPQNTLSGQNTSDAFVLKLITTAPGTEGLFYSTYLGGAGVDFGSGIDVDARGAFYVTGSTRSEDFPVTGSAYQSIRWGAGDSFIVKIDPAASPTLVYSSYLGGEALDDGRAIAVSPSGAVYVAGATLSTQFPLAGNSYRPEGKGNGDIFVVQMDLTKSGEPSLVYGTYLGGTKLDDVRRIALDAADRVLLTGYTLSPDFQVTSDALQSQLAGIANTFITRLDLKAPRSSVLSYSTYFGGSGGDVAYDIATDASGAVYLTGYTTSADFPITKDALQPAAGGGIDVFVSKLKLADSGPSALLYSTYVGLTGIHVGYALAVSPDGKIVVGGQTSGRNIKATEGSFQAGFAGGPSDGFVLVLGP
jgi:hypothetical protein